MFERTRRDIQSVFERDPAARNTFEVLTNYPGLHALMLHRLAHKLWLRDFKWLGRSISTFSRWLTGIEIHPGAQIGERFFIDHGMGVVIGETAVIGDNVTLYQGVTLGGTSWNKGKRHPTLRDGVVVGAGAKVLGPFEVGENAKIGSNAVVTKEVPPGATVVGIPGRIILKSVSDQSEVDADKRKRMEDHFGFDAYGLSEEMPDPVARSIRSILDHMHLVDERMNTMCQAIKKLDDSYKSEAVPPIKDEDIDCCFKEVATRARDAS